MKHKTIALLALAILTGTLTACGNPDSATVTDSSKNVTEGSSVGQPSETWPSEDVRLLNGFAAGGDIDVCVRLLAESLSKQTGANFFVENLKGANGSLAMEEIMNSNNPDYDFLVINTSALSANVATGLTEHSYQDMTPVSIFASYSGEVLYASADAPYDTWEDFVNYTKENHVKIGVPMGGALYAAVAVMNDYGLKLDIVDAGDASDRITSLLGNQLDCTIASYALGRDYIEKGTLKQIATLCATPIEDAPNLQCANTIISDAVVDTKFVILAKKDADPEVVAAFTDAINLCYENDAEYVEKIQSYSYQSAKPFSAEDTIAALKKQHELFQSFKRFLE